MASEQGAIAVPPFSGCVSLGKLLSLSVPPLPPWYNGKDRDSTTSYVSHEEFINPSKVFRTVPGRLPAHPSVFDTT